MDEGSEVKSGDEITLTVLKAITFPDWYLQTEDAVTSWANNACVTVTTNYQDVTDASLDGKIITQSRPNGSTVKNNDSVTITIGRLVKTNTNTNPKPSDDEEDKKDEDDTSGTGTPSAQGE